MNPPPVGARVQFWDARSQVNSGVVQSHGVLTDGTQVVTVRINGSQAPVTLPVDQVTLVAG